MTAVFLDDARAQFLSAIVTAIRNRVKQPKVGAHDGKENAASLVNTVPGMAVDRATILLRQQQPAEA